MSEAIKKNTGRVITEEKEVIVGFIFFNVEEIWLGLGYLFNDISIIVGYLMAKTSM